MLGQTVASGATRGVTKPAAVSFRYSLLSKSASQNRMVPAIAT